MLIAHGHDRSSLLELKDFIYTKIPYVNPIVLSLQDAAASTLAEKFEGLAKETKGVIALLTPDDVVIPEAGNSMTLLARARQNVIVEIGWFWGKFGRQRMLLLSRGQIELPSDLAGVIVNRFISSPQECSEAVRSFISSLEDKSNDR